MTKSKKETEEVWTQEQERLLVECVYHMTEIVDHDLNDCLMRLSKLVGAYRRQRDAKGQDVEH